MKTSEYCQVGTGANKVKSSQSSCKSAGVKKHVKVHRANRWQMHDLAMLQSSAKVNCNALPQLQFQL